MDGAFIHDVAFRNITMSNVVSPIYMFIGGRLRGPFAKPSVGNDTLIGGIFDISITDVTVDHVGSVYQHRGNHTSTIEGQPRDPKFGIYKDHTIGPNITIARLAARVSGGGAAKDVANVPTHHTPEYPPRYLGVRPSYAFFIRRAHGVTFSDVAVSFDIEHVEGRPAFVLSNVSDITLKNVTAAHSVPKLEYDVGLRGMCKGLHVSASSGLVIQKITTAGDQ